MTDTENNNKKTNRSRRAFLNSIATLTAGSGIGLPAALAVQKSPPMQVVSSSLTLPDHTEAT